MKTNSKVAYDFIKNKILYCDYQPGQLLSEREIVEELNMSRTPVRQALNTLAGENLLTIISNKGIQVTQVSEKKIKDVRELRIFLERLIIEKAVENISDKDYYILDELQKKLAEDVEKEDAKIVFKAGNSIHLFISEIADNETLTNLLRILRNDSSRGYIFFLRNKFERGSDEQRGKIKDSLRESHEAILQALREKSKEKALIAIEHDINVFNEFIF
ncbi:MAG: GntR family transcriptional regulator [Gudongella sp.]|nr:GntR family transcriptional regulator [Gudongella sp.]